MREIKFRAWIPPVTADGTTLGGFMDYELGHQKVIAIKTETRQPPADFGFEHMQLGQYFINRDLAKYGDRLMQFIGLYDKNGKEIYDGDIIQFMRAGKMRREVVEWDEFQTCWTYARLNPLSNEVIGNIYENPELLKAS